MNLLLFAAAGFGFLFSLEKEESFKKILIQTAQIFFGIVLVLMIRSVLEKFLGLQKEESGLAVIPVIYAVNALARLPFLIFLSIAGLSLPGFALPTVLFFAAFRVFMLSFRARALFFRAPSSWAGAPVFLIQAFWVSLVLAAFIVGAGFKPAPTVLALFSRFF